MDGSPFGSPIGSPSRGLEDIAYFNMDKELEDLRSALATNAAANEQQQQQRVYCFTFITNCGYCCRCCDVLRFVVLCYVTQCIASHCVAVRYVSTLRCIALSYVVLPCVALLCVLFLPLSVSHFIFLIPVSD